MRTGGHGSAERDFARVVELTGTGLSPQDVVAVARGGAKVALGEQARRVMEQSARVVARLSDSAEPVYGISTGFGSLATVAIPVERREELQRALVRSHAAGMGPAVEPEVVRAMLLLRARTFAMGRSGARPVVAEAMLALLNAGLTPVVPEHGSLGASGDLAPLAHCALALIGEGEVTNGGGTPRPAAAALPEAGITPLTLTAKEGLALVNGTDGMLGMLLLAAHDLAGLLRVADVTAAMSVEALLGTDRAFCIALAVRDMRMTADEAVGAATLGGARALRRTDVGRLSPDARADAVVLDAPSHVHLIYRPGVPLVAATILAGRVVWVDPERAMGRGGSRRGKDVHLD